MSNDTPIPVVDGTAAARSAGPVELPIFLIGLADADADRRRDLAAVLHRGGLEVADEQDDAAALGALDGLDAVVLGMDTVDSGALDAIARVLEARPRLHLIAVAGAIDNHATRKAFAVGVGAIVLEERIEESLALSVRAALAGQLSLPGEWRSQFGKPVLSARQKQVLAMVVMGFTNARIARSLGVAESTVKSHLFSAFTKLGVRSRKEATALILDPENGLGAGILTIPSSAQKGA